MSAECQMKDLMFEYNQFVHHFLSCQDVEKRLTSQLCKKHHAIHDRYHALYHILSDPEPYSIHFEFTYNYFVDQLKTLYKAGKLEIANELKTSIQIRTMFDLDEKNEKNVVNL